MKFFIDTANVDEIKKWIDIIDGVTINPFLLKKEDITIIDFLNLTKDLKIKKFIPIFNISQFDNIKKNTPGDFICKVSITPEYYSLIKELKKRRQTIAATTVYDIIQLNQAIELGCDYSMIYIAKNEDENFLNIAGKINRKNTLLVGASFRTKNHVKNAIIANMDYSTIPPEVLTLAFKNETTNNEINKMKDFIIKENL